jgi:hypothetical protein
MTARHVIGLNASSSYCVRVRGANSVGVGTWSEPLDVRTCRPNATPPATMGAPTVRADVEWLRINWAAPPDDGGSALVRFEAEAASTAGERVGSCAAPPGATNCSVDVAASTAYACRVRAVNWRGPGAWSAVTDAHSLSPQPPGQPGKPTPAVGEPLLLQWTPAEARGRKVSLYELQLDDWWAGGDGGPGYRRIYRGEAMQYQADESTERLLPASRYGVRVRATNALGVGPWSALGTLLTEPRGGCGNGPDVAVFNASRATLKGAIQRALLACAAAGSHAEECVVRRLGDSPGLSTACAQCWYAEGTCTLRECALPCLAPESAACTQCSEEKCFPACVRCSGLPRWAFPP